MGGVCAGSWCVLPARSRRRCALSAASTACNKFNIAVSAISALLHQVFAPSYPVVCCFTHIHFFIFSSRPHTFSPSHLRVFIARPLPHTSLAPSHLPPSLLNHFHRLKPPSFPPSHSPSKLLPSLSLTVSFLPSSSPFSRFPFSSLSLFHLHLTFSILFPFVLHLLSSVPPPSLPPPTLPPSSFLSPSSLPSLSLYSLSAPLASLLSLSLPTPPPLHPSSHTASSSSSSYTRG